MEGTKENWYEVRYNTKLDKLVLKKPKFTSKMLIFIRKHKLMTIVGISFIAFSILNITMIYSFMKVLEQI